MTELYESQHPNIPRIDFAKILPGSKNYDDIINRTTQTIADLKSKGVERIGFVSGPILPDNTDPDPKIQKTVREKNEANMRMSIARLTQEQGIPIFGSTSIFDVVWKELEETKLPPLERSPLIKNMFNTLLGNCVTDIFMIKGWRDAGGSLNEYDFSMNNGINIHDEDPLPPDPTVQIV